jgi:hypothetical protein
MDKRELRDSVARILVNGDLFSTEDKICSALNAIIDALPDEPPAEQHWRTPDGKTYPYHTAPSDGILVSGPEPKVEKASEPTSAGAWYCPETNPTGRVCGAPEKKLLPCPFACMGERKDLMVVRHDLHWAIYCSHCCAEGPYCLSESSAVEHWNSRQSLDEERLIDQQIEEVKAASPLTPRGEAIEWLNSIALDGWESHKVHARELLYALGQRSDPPATSGATQQPEEKFTLSDLLLGLGKPKDTTEWIAKWISPEDARKLRIMKAMEDIAKRDSTKVRFGCEMIEGQVVWVMHTAVGGKPINPDGPAAPEEPLWEGEIGHFPPTNDICPAELISAHKAPGWRKIKVREIR